MKAMEAKFKENQGGAKTVASEDPSFSITKFNSSDEDKYNSTDMLLVSDVKMNNEWIVDLGCFISLSLNQNLFLDY